MVDGSPGIHSKSQLSEKCSLKDTQGRIKREKQRETSYSLSTDLNDRLRSMVENGSFPAIKELEMVWTGEKSGSSGKQQQQQQHTVNY